MNRNLALSITILGGCAAIASQGPHPWWTWTALATATTLTLTATAIAARRTRGGGAR